MHAHESDRACAMQDAWDWMGPHWCDRGQTVWPVGQMKDFPLEIMPSPRWIGAVYTATRNPGAYTQRSLYYAKLFHDFRTGHDPHREMDWNDVRLQLSLACLFASAECEHTFRRSRAWQRLSGRVETVHRSLIHCRCSCTSFQQWRWMTAL